MKSIKDRKLNKNLAMIFIVIIFMLVGGVNPNVSQDHSVSAQTVSPCLNRVNIPISELHWLYVPETADELYTEEHFFFLAGQLIANNVVDANFCPSGGLMNNNYANACGMAAAVRHDCELK